MDNPYEQLGLATALASQSRYRAFPTARLQTWVWPAIAHHQIQFAFDESGVPVAYWTWAWLAPDVECRIIEISSAQLHESEWNEGSNLWIMDFVVVQDYLTDVVRHLCCTKFEEVAKAYSLRRHRNGELKRVATWNFASYRCRAHRAVRPTYRLPQTAFAKSQSAWLASRDQEQTASI